MLKYLLVIILYSPSDGKYVDFITSFKSNEECLHAKATLIKELTPDPKVHYAVECMVGKPTKEVSA
jgi:hypothetical protein